jgi:hypothetical protein
MSSAALFKSPVSHESFACGTVLYFDACPRTSWNNRFMHIFLPCEIAACSYLSGLLQKLAAISSCDTIICSIKQAVVKNFVIDICKFFVLVRRQKIFTKQEHRAQVLGKQGKLKNKKKKENFECAPRVSKDEWEAALTELHLFANCAHRLVEEPHELGAFIRQFSKAVGEAPFKLVGYFYQMKFKKVVCQ